MVRTTDVGCLGKFLDIMCQVFRVVLLVWVMSLMLGGSSTVKGWALQLGRYPYWALMKWGWVHWVFFPSVFKVMSNKKSPVSECSVVSGANVP